METEGQRRRQIKEEGKDKTRKKAIIKKKKTVEKEKIQK